MKQTQRRALPIHDGNALSLLTATVTAFLKIYPQFIIQPEASQVHHTRRFLGEVLGGTQVGHIQRTNANKDPSGGSREIIFPPYEHNPAMPMFPGDNGVIIGNRYHDLTGSRVSIFRRHLNGVLALWQYLGEYTVTQGERMTPGVFRGQKETASISQHLPIHWDSHSVVNR